VIRTFWEFNKYFLAKIEESFVFTDKSNYKITSIQPEHYTHFL